MSTVNNFAKPTPPKARLVLRIGVTGHRLDKLSVTQLDSLAPIVRDQLETNRGCLSQDHRAHGELFAAEKPVVRVISPLAEGADQLVARGGLELGCELHGLLPFGREDYLATFSDAARRGAPSVVAEFDRLLQQASAVFTLDGSLGKRERAFEFLGKVLLNQVDLLIAIWDGQPAADPGGTERVVRDAITQGVPVVWLDPGNPAQPRLLTTASELASEVKPGADLCSVVNELLMQPPSKAKADSHDEIHAEDRNTTFSGDYLKETQPERDYLGGY